MIPEADFKAKAAEAIDDLEERVIRVAEEHEFEVETGGGMLTLIFEEPAPSRFIVSPNSPARQIWVSALSTSYKFDWDDNAKSFVLDKTREPFLHVMGNLLGQQLRTTVSLTDFKC
jgi:iron donor protein CyaY